MKNVLITALVWLASSPLAQACSVCFGKSDSNMAKGLNMGIFALLLVITSMLALISTFFVFIARRGAQVEHADHTAGAEQSSTTEKV